jgi:hypothetical protein
MTLCISGPRDGGQLGSKTISHGVAYTHSSLRQAVIQSLATRWQRPESLPDASLPPDLFQRASLFVSEEEWLRRAREPASISSLQILRQITKIPSSEPKMTCLVCVNFGLGPSLTTFNEMGVFAWLEKQRLSCHRATWRCGIETHQHLCAPCMYSLYTGVKPEPVLLTGRF